MLFDVTTTITPVIDVATPMDMLHEVNFYRRNLMNTYIQAVDMAETNHFILEWGRVSFLKKHPNLGDLYNNTVTALAEAATHTNQEIGNMTYNFSVAISHWDEAASNLEQMLEQLDEN